MRATYLSEAAAEYVAASVRHLAKSQDHLACLKFSLDAIQGRIERSLEAIRVSQTLLEKL
jgi:hypothetical protein